MKTKRCSASSHTASVSFGKKLGAEPSSRSYQASARLVELARRNKNVADVFRLLGAAYQLDWVDLYKLLEIVKSDVEGEDRIVQEGWATRRELGALRASANRADVSGDEARHARDVGDPPARTMQQAEARSFVLRLVNNWIELQTSERSQDVP